jgi:hypothetical protein
VVYRPPFIFSLATPLKFQIIPGRNSRQAKETDPFILNSYYSRLFPQEVRFVTITKSNGEGQYTRPAVLRTNLDVSYNYYGLNHILGRIR